MGTPKDSVLILTLDILNIALVTTYCPAETTRYRSRTIEVSYTVILNINNIVFQITKAADVSPAMRDETHRHQLG